jgi:hypothetical protein
MEHEHCFAAQNQEAAREEWVYASEWDHRGWVYFFVCEDTGVCNPRYNLHIM